MKVMIDGLVVMETTPALFVMRMAIQGNHRFTPTEGAKVEFVLETGERETEIISFADEG